jgi:hypothetical protein
MQRRSPLFYAVVIAGAFVLFGSGLGAWRLKRFVDSDPRLCAQCHRASPEFSLWSNGSHKSVACQRCHHSTPEQGLTMLRAFVAGRSPSGSKTHAPVEIGSCASCHLSHDGNWPQVGNSRGHRIHFEEKGIACVTCHAEGMHGFHPLTDACRKCHGTHTVRAQGMAKLHCFVCHDFLSPDPGLLPTRRDCLRCHRSEGVHPARFAEGAPMQFDCGTCHKPHAATPGESIAACTHCHVVAETAGLHVRHARQGCTTCHLPHLWTAGKPECLRCHAGADKHAEAKRCTACHPFRSVQRKK